MKILVVCLGNICRSPLAEGILQNKLHRYNNKFKVDSAGMISYHVGEPPDYRSIATAEKYHLDISGQRARKFHQNDFLNFDLILAMDSEVLSEILSYPDAKKHQNKIYLFLEYAGFPGKSNVPDPYYGTQDDFDRAYHLIDEASELIAKKLTVNQS